MVSPAALPVSTTVGAWRVVSQRGRGSHGRRLSCREGGRGGRKALCPEGALYLRDPCFEREGSCSHASYRIDTAFRSNERFGLGYGLQWFWESKAKGSWLGSIGVFSSKTMISTTFSL